MWKKVSIEWPLNHLPIKKFNTAENWNLDPKIHFKNIHCKKKSRSVFATSIYYFMYVKWNYSTFVFIWYFRLLDISGGKLWPGSFFLSNLIEVWLKKWCFVHSTSFSPCWPFILRPFYRSSSVTIRSFEKDYAISILI